MKHFDRIYIEISNICNLQCSFCPEVLRPKKIMPLDLFEKIIAEVAPFTAAVTLHVMGEPLAHPQFSEFLNILEKNSVPLILTSNGTLLDRHRLRLLNCSIIKQINFSVHSFFDNFPDKPISDYLLRLTTFALDFTNHHPASFINFRLWNLPHTATELSNNNLKIYDELSTLFSNPELPSQIDITKRKSYRLDRHIKLHLDTQFDWPQLNAAITDSDGSCYGLRNQIAILTEGTVVPCCLDKEAIINLGSLKDHSLSTILNSERAHAIRIGFSKRKAVEPLCRKCQYKIRFNK